MVRHCRKGVVSRAAGGGQSGGTCAEDRINRQVEVALGRRVEFNEVLSVLYREGQKMNWHDDGEVGLGPVVASLSLGSVATMSWRPKGRKCEVKEHARAYGQVKRENAATVLSITLSHGVGGMIRAWRENVED
jgi:hypothetical protein